MNTTPTETSRELATAPLSLLLDGNPSAQTLLTTLGMQLFWCIAMSVISRLFWKASLRQITVNGG